MEELLKRARELGRKAYYTHAMKAPYLDKVFWQLVVAQKSHQDRSKLMTEWHKGWDDEAQKKIDEWFNQKEVV